MYYEIPCPEHRPQMEIYGIFMPKIQELETVAEQDCVLPGSAEPMDLDVAVPACRSAVGSLLSGGQQSARTMRTDCPKNVPSTRVRRRSAPGEVMPGIHLPCIIRLFGPSTGNPVDSMGPPFLYVSKGVFGDHLYMGRSLSRVYT